MDSDSAENWVIVCGSEHAGHVVRRSEAIARIQVTDGGLYRWQLLADRRTEGVAPTAVTAAAEARAAWRARRA